jgi:hypothetical protein
MENNFSENDKEFLKNSLNKFYSKNLICSLILNYLYENKFIESAKLLQNKLGMNEKNIEYNNLITLIKENDFNKIFNFIEQSNFNQIQKEKIIKILKIKKFFCLIQNNFNNNNNNQNNYQNNFDPYDFQENDNFDINQYLLNEQTTVKIEIEDILENLFVLAQNEKNYNEKIKYYEEIIETERKNYQTKLWTYKSYEQLVYIYCESLDRENVVNSLTKLIDLREEVDDNYSEPVMQNIILILQNPDIIQLSRPVVSSVVKVLHASNGNKDYYTQLLKFLQSTKLFFMEDESKANFPINLLIPYINDISVFNLEVNVVGNEEQPKIIGGQNYSPPIGWTSYEFDIYHHYDNGDETWLKCNGNPGEWAIAYHGTARAINQNNKILEIVENIYKTNLKVGSGQACSHHPNINVNTKGKYKVCGKGVYLTPNIAVAESYSAILNIDGKKYSVVLQFKVNPETLRISNSHRDYWICDGNINSVRPYRLLIRERK